MATAGRVRKVSGRGGPGGRAGGGARAGGRGEGRGLRVLPNPMCGITCAMRCGLCEAVSD